MTASGDRPGPLVVIRQGGPLDARVEVHSGRSEGSFVVVALWGTGAERRHHREAVAGETQARVRAHEIAAVLAIGREP